MTKTTEKIALYTEKVERLIKKGLITEANIIDTAIKSEYDKKKAKKEKQ